MHFCTYVRSSNVYVPVAVNGATRKQTRANYVQEMKNLSRENDRSVRRQQIIKKQQLDTAVQQQDYMRNVFGIIIIKPHLSQPRRIIMN